MIVADASAALAALLNAGPARRTLESERLHVPHLIDAEVANALRRLIRTGELDANAGADALAVWRRLGMKRYPVVGYLPRVWELQEDVTAYDGCYVALAEHLGCALVSADARLGRAPGSRCSITLVPR